MPECRQSVAYSRRLISALGPLSSLGPLSFTMSAVPPLSRVTGKGFMSSRSSLPMSTSLRRLRVDHLVYGAPGPLTSAMEAFQRRTGVCPAIGGTHASLGTHNALVSLGDGAYFEILCRDPDQPSPPRLWMGMESVGDGCNDPPVLLTWATDRAGQMEEVVRGARNHSYDPGDVQAFSRATPDGGTLHWSLAYRHYTREQMGPGRGIVPFLIDWEGSASPAASAPTGCELIGLRAEAVDPRAVARNLSAIGIDATDLDLREGPADRLIAVLRTPTGIVEF